MYPGLDPEMMAGLIEDAGAPPPPQAQLDNGVLDSLKQDSASTDRRQQYLRDKYVWGMVAPLEGTRLTYTKKALQEVTASDERQWLVGEVGKVAQAQEATQTQEYNQSGYLRRFSKNAQKVGGAFVNAGTGMVESLKGLATSKTDSPENIQFMRALESARQGGNPFANEAPGISGKLATGLAGMTPDVAAGVLAGATGGPAATVGYWTARQYPERRAEYAALGLNPTAAAAAGGASALAESALWALDRDPTGLSKGLISPVKGLITKGVEGIANQTAKRAAELGLEAAAHTGLGTFRTGAQAIVRGGGEALAGSGQSAGDVLGQAASEAASAAPMLAVMAGVGAGGKVPGAFSDAKRVKMRQEILAVAESGDTPSREQWRGWGFAPEEGRSRELRRNAVQTIAKTYNTVEQLQAVASEVAPSTEQWKRWGLAPEDGKTEEQRKAYVQQKFTPPAPEPTQEVMPEAQPATAAPGEPAPTEQPGVQQQATNASEQALQTIAPATESVQEAQGPAPSVHDFPVEMVGTGERIGGREVVRELEHIWGVPIRSGRMGYGPSSGVRGIYKLKAEVARLAKGEESSASVAIHEAIGHHLDNTTDVLRSASERAKQEVGTMDYDQGKARPAEGFAEFVRSYLTGSTARFPGGVDAAQAAPEFYQHFQQWLGEHPDVNTKLEASREPIVAFQKAGAVGRVKGQISETGKDIEHQPPLVQRVNDLKEYLYTRLKEEGRPIQLFTNEAMRRGYKPGSETTPFEDYNALRQVGPHFAQRAIEDGVFRLTGNQEKIGPSLTEALREIDPNPKGDDYKNFVAWTYARHAIESWQKGKNPGITMDDANETFHRLYDPRYEEAANKVTQFNNALIGVLTDVGVIDAESADRILSMYQTYIPLERAKEGGRGGGGRRMVDLSAAVKGRRGSGLQIIDPIESSLSRAIRLYERAAQQLVVNKLVSVSTDVKGMGGWVEEVPAKVVATTFSVDEIKKQLSKAIETSSGVTDASYVDDLLKNIDPLTALTVWRPDLAKIHGIPIVRVTIEGKPRFFQVDPELAQALGGLDSMQHLDIATRIARSFTSALKIGATRLNPDFILKNAFRDLDTFIMQGEKGLTGALDPAKYAAAYVATELQKSRGEPGDPVVELWQKMGGELSTYAGLDRARLKAGVSRALAGKQGKFSTALNMAGLTEAGPRIAEFSAILQREGWIDRVKAGETPPMPVLTRAINAAHDVTVDFRRMGEWGRYLNYYIPFFNARLEGVDKFVRTWKDNPGRSAIRSGQWMASRAMLYWWLRHNDDDYKERPAWQDGFFILKDTQGNPTVRIPKSQEWGAVESGVERMMDAMYDKDPSAITRWFSQVVGTVNPAGYPSGVTPLFEAKFNYDSFRDRPIISSRLQKLEAPDQYYDYTSKFAKMVSKTLHDASGGNVSLSPAQIDHLANGLSGGLYNTLVSTPEKGIGLFRGESVGVGDVPGLRGLALRKDYAKSVDDLYTQKEALDKAHESNKLRDESAKKPEDVSAWRRLQGAAELMTEMRKASHDLSVDDKTKTEIAMTGLARAALGREPLGRYPNPMADPSSVPSEVQAAVVKHIAQKAITMSSATSKQPKAIEEATGAYQYLHDMGVQGGMAQDIAYARLRSQGVKGDTAKARSGRVGKLLP